MIDLETTFGDQLGEDESDRTCCGRRVPVPPQAEEASQELDADGNPIATDDDDDDEDEQANMSLAAMEAALKPRFWKRLN